MLDFIDRFADPRYVADKQLRCLALWMGTVESEAELTAYLAPDSVEKSRFVADAGDDFYDVDFLEAGCGETRPVEAIIDEFASAPGLRPEPVEQLRQAAVDRGVTEANAWIILNQHVYEGDAAVDFGGLTFVGNVEYRQAEPVEAASPVQLFVGVTDQPTLADLRGYVVNEFVGELGVELSGLQYYGYKLRQQEAAITPRELFELELVQGRVKFTDALPDIERACDERGLDRINAFVAGEFEGTTSLDLDASARFAGLQYLGVFDGVVGD